ncbi:MULTISPECIES: FecR family protein [Agrobacterium]|uniref:Iron dicitrate transport regulator FecR n=1 Tax=Agrobacterium rosae TaxID=1972867 RepID=A0AAE5VMT7_9HYPH|nr:MULTISPECIES: FecR domain-containing protein [Agrobacterium]KAA3508882.1 iron dicitrate transport regulator FecR [Agrobacterium rosae]KAA3513458.1 iron dicitrate transport regulator FecR [Agrobacterium rosae]MQB51012.1 iron dicitrate transport regulator FecR [Agrobacterium rosae]POO49396.1 iron dicitrate transport regulator FecR [Agrobacterium rosae]SCX16667.1 fec operon regulator FecR [Agrobacterium sp. DSM 25558]
MNVAAPDPQRLLDEAIDLVIRLQVDPGNSVTLEMIRTWRKRGPEYEEAWSSVADAHGMSGKVLTDRATAENRKRLGLTRRNFVIGGTVGLGAALAGTIYGPSIILQAKADYFTAKGEIRDFQLQDGSVATLGPDSAIAVNYTPEKRGIDLLSGMSFFDVVRDPRRPFVVQTAGLTATAIGTAFDVANDAGILTISVDHGIVEARTSVSSRETGERLRQGEWLSFDPSSDGIQRGTRDLAQIAVWRDNVIVAERETVSALIARISRWYPGRIVIADPFVGSQRISGLFDLRNPQRALEAVVLPAGAQVRRISSNLTIISPV